MKINLSIQGKVIIFIKILFVSCFTFAQNERIITYEKAIKIALKNNLDIKQTSNDIKINKALYSSSKLSFLPQLSANSNGARTKGFQFSPQEQALVDQEISTLRINLRADLVVFNGFSNYFNFKRNKNLLQAKESELKQLNQNIVFETSQKYIQYLLDEEILKIAVENKNINKQLYEQVSEFVVQGQRAGLDSISQLATYERSKLEVSNAQNKVALDQLDLLRTLAIDSTNDVVIVAPDRELLENDFYNANIDELVKKAFLQRADLFQLENEKRAFKSLTNSLRGSRLPTASIFYRYGSEFISNRSRVDEETGVFEEVPFGTQLFEENIVSQYGFNIFIPLFTNFNNRGNIVRSKVGYENKEYQIEDLKRKIALDIRNAVNNYRQLKQAYEVSKRASKVSQLSFEKQKELYDLGIGDLITLNIESQRNFTAKSQELQAKYTLLFQQKIIDYQVGEILKKEGTK